MDLLTTRSLVSIRRSARSMRGSVLWLTASRTLKSGVVPMHWSLTLTSPTSSGLVPDSSYPGWAKASETARNLGVIIDQQLTFDAHACSRTCFYHLRRIRQIRRSMQWIQNSATRLVCSEPAFSHTAPLLHSLHWLPVARHIKYKLCVLMFDIYHGTAPVYMTDLCSCCSNDCLRPSARGNFLVRQTRTRFANSSFTVAGPAAWNSLPAHIRTIDSHSAFCRHLKTYLFTVPDCLNLTLGLYPHMYT